MSYYAVTLTFFYHRDSRDYFSPTQSALPQTRYMAILNVLGPQRTRSDGMTEQWTAPMSPDRDTSHVAGLIRQLCGEIGFVEGTSIASLDDDLILLRSHLVDDMALAHVRNPKKG
ncbi:hypothetical protein F441_17913 [Phytophthora nicotianae CJ01A1]|uniref:PiggyBac transposable element-derived protein domain-containing protein n=2 Tax=Phytophthora nicotianae TaxID=4792 RepID=W2G0Z1_PHYNI|nr:hypothetical protein L915_17556 [Phytophthora nicotianae]ETL29355.1 hypothetical protein L916_17449 [Phytophthora nicotianae]ETP05470.1 hypothetical protein F441_17913 [Phytophthora nicotianae CJ01A1]